MFSLSWAAQDSRTYKGEYDKAIEDYAEAIRLDPKQVLAYVYRGRAWAFQDKYDKAIQDYSEAIRLDPKSAAGYSGRALVWNAQNEYDKAIKDFTDAIRADPKNIAAFFGRGNVWLTKRITRRRSRITPSSSDSNRAWVERIRLRT